MRGTRGATRSRGQRLLYPPPSLDLRFAETKSLTDWISGQDLITFSRASSGTVVNAAGALETVASNLPRLTHNPLTGESLGLLLEEQRTNLLLNSATLSTQNVTVTAVAHTLSFTGTGTVTLSGVSTAGPLVGTGAGEANRVSLTFTPTAGTLTLTVSGTVTDAQLEAGSSGTTYIPTAGATATRSADLASITGTNFSSWYRQDEGTVFAEARTNATHGGTNSFPRVFALNDGGSNNIIEGYFRVLSSYTDAGCRVDVAGVNQVQFNTNDQRNGQRQSIGYAVNNFAFVVGGATVNADTSGSVPIITQLRLGARGDGGSIANGTIRRLTYWPQRLPNNSLVAITR